MSDNRVLALFQSMLGGISAGEVGVLRDLICERLVTAGLAVSSGGVITTTVPLTISIDPANLSAAVPVNKGGTFLTAGTSGGVLAFTAAGVIASSAALAANQVVLGGGSGAVPATLGSLGTTTTLLHGNAAGAPTFGSVVNADIAASTIDLTAKVTGTLPTANGGTGIAFFTAAGPTAARIFTFPDAAATVLTSNAAVTVPQGGTGLATLTANGIVLGAGAASPTFLAPGTSGNVATSNGTIWTSAGPPTRIVGGVHHNGSGQVQASTAYHMYSAQSGTEANSQVVVPLAMTLTALYVMVDAVGGAGQSATFTLRKNGVDTAITCVINTGSTTANDTAHSVAYAAGDLISMKCVTSATTGTVKVSAGWG